MNEPKLRFPGFTGGWEKRKLSELSTMHARIGWQNLRTSEFLDDGDYLLVTGTDFNNGTINYSTCHYVEKERYEQDKNIQIQNGNILITKDGTLGKVAYVQNLNMPATLNAGVFNVEVKDTNFTDSKYLFQYLKAPFLMDYASKNSTGGTIKHLNQNILVDFPVAIPEIEEQQKIASLFTELDTLIQSAEKELEGYRELKQGMLQKMFPKKDETVPEIRFPEFTGTWEYHKLGEIATEILAGGDIDKEKVVDEGTYPIYANALTNGGLVGYYNDYYRVKAPAVTVTGRGEVGHAQARTTDFTPVVRLLVVRSQHNCYFLENAINNHKVIVESTGVPQLTVPQLSSYNICFPKNIEEEIKIGKYFHNLDCLIASQQQELDGYKELKKGLLQQMLC